LRLLLGLTNGVVVDVERPRLHDRIGCMVEHRMVSTASGGIDRQLNLI
jgi:hypothetical protein